MATEKQIAANRANAQKSTGPKTPGGKASSRRNALKHGLAGDGVALSDEMRDEVQAELVGFNRRYKPQDFVEERYVLLMALAAVRAVRCHVAHEERLKQRRRTSLRDHDEARAAEVAAAARRLPLEPGPALVILERTAEGCDYLSDRWDELAAALESPGHWTGHQEEFALRLLGESKSPTAATPGVAARLAVCALASRPNFNPGVADRYFGGSALLPPADAAREELKAIVAAEMARLAERGDQLWDSYDGPDRAAAPLRALASADPECDALSRYATAAHRQLKSAEGMLNAGRRAAARERNEPNSPPAPKPEQAAHPMPRPLSGLALRPEPAPAPNEPNVPPTPAPQPSPKRPETDASAQDDPPKRPD